MRKGLSVLIILVLLLAMLPACSSGGNDSQSDGSAVGWEFFESCNPIGDTYGNISKRFDSLEDEGTFDGGVVLKVDGNDRLFFGFPRLSKEDIEDDVECTSVYGNMETLFGVDEYINVSQMIEMLDVDLVQDYDGLYIATKAVGSDTYMIRFEINNIEDDISPDTHIAIFQGQQE